MLTFLIVTDALMIAAVLLAGLVVLIRRRAALGRRGSVALAGVVAALIAVVADGILSVMGVRAIFALADGGRLTDLSWIGAARLAVLPLEVVALPLLAWAVLAGRQPRPARDAAASSAPAAAP
jgi:hypothetical protein